MATKKKGQEAESSKEAIEKSASSAVSKTNPAPANKAKQPAKSPSPKDSEKKKGQPGGIVASIGQLRQFLKDVYQEFNKITWPHRQQVVQETVSVLFLVTVITLMVLAFDWFLGTAIFGPLEHWARLHGGGVGRG